MLAGAATLPHPPARTQSERLLQATAAENHTCLWAPLACAQNRRPLRYQYKLGATNNDRGTIADLALACGATAW